MLALCGRENPDYKFGIGIGIVILATVRTGGSGHSAFCPVLVDCNVLGFSRHDSRCRFGTTSTLSTSKMLHGAERRF
jgi:hypothetical protein